MGHIYVPMLGDICTLVLLEAYCAPYFAHLDVKKMHVDLKQVYFWARVRHDIIDFVVRCLECQRVKTKHQHPTGLLQPMPFQSGSGIQYLFILS